jgi:hypothetical protein
MKFNKRFTGCYEKLMFAGYYETTVCYEKSMAAKKSLVAKATKL